VTPLRVTEPIELASLLAANVPKEWRDKPFSATHWLSDPRNIALRIGPDLSMFDHLGPNIYMGHSWFATRGRAALAHGRAMLDAMFHDYGAELIRGETPTTKPAALMFAKLLGFTVTGEAIRPIGKVTLSELRFTNLHARKSVA
jgi:hypothetical protein